MSSSLVNITEMVIRGWPGRRQQRKTTPIFWSLSLCFGLILLVGGAASAQESVEESRITGRIDDSVRTVAHGNIHPEARAAYDQGLLDPGTKLDRITMRFRMTAAQEADLNTLLAQLQNPSSPNFHKWLTPEQFGSRFGISQTDVNTLASWLGARGLQIVGNGPESKLDRVHWDRQPSAGGFRHGDSSVLSLR